MQDRFAARRRDVLAAGVAAGALGFGGEAAAAQQDVTLVVDPADPIAAAPAAQWALGYLREALTGAGVSVSQVERMEQAPSGTLCVIASGAAQQAATLRRARVTIGDGPERLALISARVAGRDTRVACGTDAVGLSYALTELADRVRAGRGLALPRPIVEQPTNAVRSIMRQFVSEPLDKPWFSDREQWRAYLDMLAANRFNRFHLTFGLGYDFLRNVEDSYFLFIYPFLVAPAGYDVSLSNYTAEERAANLETLRFISEQTVKRGLVFQLGIWMHGYAFTNSPKARHIVQGLNADNHARYCRDALTALLKACPAISSVTLRSHGESGIAEGSYDFWKIVFDGVPAAGREIEIDLHAKGIDQRMIDQALATGMPVNVAPKYWAEHLGMPYHQAAVREWEMPKQGQVGAGLMSMSEGQRSHTRYGYSDLMRDDRRYSIRHRIFAGTQRLLLNADIDSTRAYAQRFQFCDSAGVDIMEPYTCRGRRGTGIEGTRRSGYVDASLEPRWDWQKFDLWYRLWGRLTYNAQTDNAVLLRHGPIYGLNALALASRILPIVTTAHSPSAACDAFWPECYWNQPLTGEPSPNVYGDMPAPKVFQNVSALDPQLFLSCNECADELLSGETSGKYSPLEVARWLEDLARNADVELERAGAANSVEARRLAIDVRMQAHLGRFFAEKFRAGVLYALHERSNDRRALDEALTKYRAALAAWDAVVNEARGVYADDLSVSDKISERGAWSDKRDLIAQDIASLEARASQATSSTDAHVGAAINAALATPRVRSSPLVHEAPASFASGEALQLSVRVARARSVSAVRCFYRHVNQAERWVEIAMTQTGGVYRAEIPGAYTASPYPLQYYFAAQETASRVTLHPTFGANLMQEPYYVVRRA